MYAHDVSGSIFSKGVKMLNIQRYTLQDLQEIMDMRLDKLRYLSSSDMTEEKAAMIELELKDLLRIFKERENG